MILISINRMDILEKFYDFPDDASLDDFMHETIEFLISRIGEESPHTWLWMFGYDDTGSECIEFRIKEEYEKVALEFKMRFS